MWGHKRFPLVRVVEPPYVWRVPRSELESARRILTILSRPDDRPEDTSTIKDSGHKSIRRLPGDRATSAIYVKTYKRNSIRYLFRTPPASREARIMLKLQGAGVPVNDLVAVGIRRKLPFEVENVLVIRSPSNLQTLGTWSFEQFQERGESARRQVSLVLTRILASVRRIHEVNVYHGDLNPGNILIDPDEMRFYFIDFHRSRFLWPGDIKRRTEDISEVLEYFSAYYDRRERLDLAAVYASSESLLCRSIRDSWDKVHRKRMERRIATVAGQCCENRTYFRTVQSDTRLVYMDRKYDAGRILEWISGPDLPEGLRGEDLTGSPTELREIWRSAVEKSMREQIRETPVAMILETPSEQRGRLIWDTRQPAHYRLSHIFSLERFDPQGDHFLPCQPETG
ncbi:MAG TPA: lipopolysaccharide kinase InaA family protein [bacterium]|nr:lipopolysaccharide kinase InaA family protein [bacterium]HQL60868.1 lipopolysaccharide kinase InaA family protein [bacterium]